MNSPVHNNKNKRRAALPWPVRARRRRPAMWRLAFVALVAALSFVLAGPVTTVSAAPPPSPAADSPSGRPGFWDRLNWKIHEYMAKDALDPHDPHYVRKSVRQIAIQRVLTQLTKGWPAVKDLPSFLEDAHELNQRKEKTLEGRTKRVTEAGDRIHEANEKVAQAKTPKEKQQAEEEVRKARRHYDKVAAELRDIKETLPKDTPAQIKDLDKKISKLENKIGDLERKKRKFQLPGGRKLVQQQIDAAREELDHSEQERKQLQGRRDDGGDTDGTRPAKRGPKTPTQGPGTTSAKTPKTPAISSTTPSPKTAISGTKIPPKAPTITTLKPQTLPVGPRMKLPGLGNIRGAMVAQTLGDLLGQAYMDQKSQEHRKLLDKAMNDPALRKRIINEYKEFERQNPVEQLGRPFKGKEFTPGELYDNGSKLVEVQKTLDRVKAKADRSNADPLYRQARRECGGYDTCVTTRTRQLRNQNAKDIAASTRKARKSNADPLYQQARQECGGYDTCVTARTRKLRQQAKDNAKDIAESTKRARKSNADPLYQQARQECGGYDTCVTARTRQLRQQAKDAIEARADKDKRDRGDTRAQDSQKASDSKKKTDTSERRSDRDDRGQHKNTGPVKNKHENKAV
ncbi:hypothetical protein ACTPOK_08430 [Streptomyces inhibens]|uniref:hypothetical protein n=1 Tax=Streptomyces inhibens TaxID=2293571 RepID=UPI00402AE8F2